VLAVASLDSDAPVRGDAVGARAMTGAISLGAAAEALHKCTFTSTANVVFGFTDADHWGYTGARALAELLTKPNNIQPDLLISGQPNQPVQGTAGLLSRTTKIIGVGSTNNATLYSHTESGAANSDLQSLLSEQAEVDGVRGGGLPPSAVHAYLLRGSSIPATVLSQDREAPFSNQFTDSQFDDHLNVDSDAVVSGTRAIVKALAAAAGASSLEITACAQLVNASLVTAWLEWAGGTPNCSGLCRTLSDRYGAGPVNTYTSVANGKLKSRLTQSLLDHFHGMGSPVVLTLAVSPGFKYESRRRSWKITDKSQPLFTESTWEAPQLKILKQDPFWVEWLTFVLGAVSLSLSFLGTKRLLQIWAARSGGSVGV